MTAHGAIGLRAMSAHVGLLLLVLLAVLAGCASGDDRPIDVGNGRQLYLHCEGEGNPTVVMEAGGAGNSESWGFVQPDVSKFTRVCTYDRAGTGRSSAVPRQDTTQAIAQELHSLLRVAGVGYPYVLVGHSFGGIIVLQFATQYQNEIAGIVMVDSSGSDPRGRIQAALTPDEWQQYGSVGHDDSYAFPEGADISVPDLGNTQLIVISAGRGGNGDVPPIVAEKIDNVRLEMHRELLDLSVNSKHIIAEESDHAIPSKQPDLIVAAIRQVVDAIRQDNR